MVKKKTRQQNGSGSVFHLPEVNPYDSKRESEAAWLWDEIKNGRFLPDTLALMGEDGSMVITMFLMAFKIISTPTHPDNNWRSIVETMPLGKAIYYRLAADIPIPVMEYWKKHGHPPAYGWDYFDPNASSVGKSTSLSQPAPITPKPSKPIILRASARKARKAPRKPSAKKPEPTVELTPEQQQIASAKKISAIALELIAARTKKR